MPSRLSRHGWLFLILNISSRLSTGCLWFLSWTPYLPSQIYPCPGCQRCIFSRCRSLRQKTSRRFLPAVQGCSPVTIQAWDFPFRFSENQAADWRGQAICRYSSSWCSDPASWPGPCSPLRECCQEGPWSAWAVSWFRVSHWWRMKSSCHTPPVLSSVRTPLCIFHVWPSVADTSGRWRLRADLLPTECRRPVPEPTPTTEDG